MSPRPPHARLARVLRPLVLLFAVSLSAAAAHGNALPPPPMDAAQLRLALEKLRVTGTALYVAAHPDDENTAMLTWLANGRKVRTAYLAMTRGDGGQNLIGPDVSDRLGVIRTQELLGARRIDDAEQYFTRALDFGYSKNPDETLALWGREQVLSDVVRVIRTLRPDVIVNRFNTDPTGNHGHHTASALLAEEAFTAAADPARFPDQIAAGLKPWQAKRVVWNAYRFGAAGVDTTPGRVRVDLGAYDPLLGRSYTELAGESRSMHKSQGFGAAERRGTWENTFEHRLGERATTDLFEGVELGWKRIPGGDKVDALLARALKSLDPARPHAIVPTLLDALAAMETLPDEPIVRHHRETLLGVIRSAAGLWVEAIATRPLVSPGSTVRVVTTAIDRTGLGVAVRQVAIRPGGAGWTRSGVVLKPNVAWTDTVNVSIAADAPLGQPYWLAEPTTGGLAVVRDASLIGLPETPPAIQARFTLEIGKRTITVETPLVYRWVDPVEGERYRAMEVAPPVRLRFDRDFRLARPALAGNGAHAGVRVGVVVAPGDVAASGTLGVSAPAGWSVRPGGIPLSVRPGAPDTTIYFEASPPAAGGTASVPLRASFETGGRSYDTRVVELDYSHIPMQVMQPPATVRVVATDARLTARNVGYLMGSGDAGPDALRELGAAVTLLEDSDVEVSDLARFDAIVVGVRAYNTRPRLRALQPRLLDYVVQGGRLVVQYQTADRELVNRLGPFPFTISRDRVTVEEAEMRALKADHPLLNRPNKIGADDWTGWVQERGLYYANPFDAKYDAVLAANDPGEPGREGGLLFARHGKGTYVYTGLAFFRQLPAGVPGAWRLFANLVSPER
jgi:LmbE family N-acetylglucosaminyl deacetylase